VPRIKDPYGIEGPSIRAVSRNALGSAGAGGAAPLAHSGDTGSKRA
jgi:hypothetical protein